MPTAQCVQRHLRAIHQLFIGAWVFWAWGAIAETTPLPVFTIIASEIHSYEGGTPLRYGINIVNAEAIADAVSLPPATGSGQQIDVHIDTDYLILIWVPGTGQINRYGEGVAYAAYPRQRLRFLDVAIGNWDFTSNLPMFYPIYTEMRATPGGGHAESRYLGMGTNIIRYADNPGDSVRLPIAVGGTSPIILYNDTSVRVTVFPDFGQKLNREPNNKPYDLPPGKLALFHDIGPGPNQWIGGVVDAGYTLQFQSKGGVFRPEPNTTYYLGQGLEASIYPSVQRMRIPRAGRISSISTTFTNQGPGSGENSTLYLRKNNVDDTQLSADVTSDGIFHEVVAEDLDIVVDRGDHIEIKWVTPAWAENPVFVTIRAHVAYANP